VSELNYEKFGFLKKMALEKGAMNAEIIAADKVVVEDRIVLKCKFGCTKYGKTLTCPPYTPTPQEFRKIVNEYTYVLFMKFKSRAKTNSKLTKYLSKSETDLTIPKSIRSKLQEFWADWKKDKLKMLSTVLDLETAAMREGYLLAIGLISGFCQLCEECTLNRASCVNPTKARFSGEAVGVNVQATAKNAGVEFKFPVEKTPETFALLLID
jgi:predicted metal-binding protein